jgi:hypothetical protein
LESELVSEETEVEDGGFGEEVESGCGVSGLYSVREWNVSGSAMAIGDSVAVLSQNAAITG